MRAATTYEPRHMSDAEPTGLQSVREMRAVLTARGRAAAVILRGRHRAYDVLPVRRDETGTEAA
ncbi:hypothetical protein IF650_13195 [Cellulosimicrobium terreum]|nr:hypothetical protein [Cellulosimicrobium terreum]